MYFRDQALSSLIFYWLKIIVYYECHNLFKIICINEHFLLFPTVFFYKYYSSDQWATGQWFSEVHRKACGCCVREYTIMQGFENSAVLVVHTICLSPQNFSKCWGFFFTFADLICKNMLHWCGSYFIVTGSVLFLLFM